MDNIPRGIAVATYPEYVHITMRIEGWAGLSIRLFMTALAILAWVIFIDDVQDAADAHTVWVYAWLALPLCFALVVSYLALAHWRNSTHVMLSRDALEIYQAPVWMPGHLRLDPRHIEQVYVRHNPRSRRSTIELRAKLDTHEDIKLFSILYPVAYAHYVERLMEQYLGIENRQVSGEYNES